MGKFILENIKPSLEPLQKRIAFYFFSKSSGEDYPVEYTFYPHIFSTLAIYKDSKIQTSDYKSTVYKNPKNTLSPIFYGRAYEKSIDITIKEGFEKITIVFYPLGINSFIERPLSKISTEYFFEFKEWGNEFQPIAQKIFKEDSLQEKGRILDEFLIKKLNPFTNENLNSCLQLMLDSDPIKVGEIADSIGINRKTLFSLFKNNLCISPNKFYKILRFRKAINQFVNYRDRSNLTDVSLESGYYDQSSLIKDFHTLTGNNPKAFFDYIERVGTEDTFFKIR